MRNLIRMLNEICIKNFFAEKVLLTPTFSAGQELLHAFTGEGCSSLNLKTDTLFSLAEKICRGYIYRNNLTVISDALVNHLFQGILQELKSSGELGYFNEQEITPGISRAVGNAVLELKMAGFGSADVQEAAFVSLEKGQDIKNIFAEYERILKDKGYLDPADVYSLAVKILEEKQNKQNTSDVVYIIPSNLRLQPLERRFLKALTGNDYQVVYLSPVKGLGIPRNYAVDDVPETQVEVSADIDRLSWLYDLEKAPAVLDDGTVELFQAYGESNEAREIIRRIRKQKLPLDQAAVFYTSQELYGQLFYALAQKFDLPVTFEDGIDIKNSRPGRLFFALTDWLKNNYEASRLVSIITSGDFTFKDEEAPSKSRIARMIRTAGIGWGRDRYLSKIRKQIGLLEEKIKEIRDSREAGESGETAEIAKAAEVAGATRAAETTEAVGLKEAEVKAVVDKDRVKDVSDNKVKDLKEAPIKKASENAEGDAGQAVVGDMVNNAVEYIGEDTGIDEIEGAGEDAEAKALEEKLQGYLWLENFFKGLFKLIPGEDQEGKYSYRDLSQGLATLIDKYSLVAGEIDGEAKKAIVENLNLIAGYAGERLELEDILNRWHNLIGGIRVCRSTPKPGHLHVGSYRNAVWVFRPYTFIVGLDAARFPGQTREDPIILDVERKRLSPDLYLNESRVKDNLYEMAQLLANLEGKITLSYSAFDTVENREVFPSSLLLQVYRLAKGEAAADYSDLLGSFEQKAGFIPEKSGDAADEAEYWLNLEFKGRGVGRPLASLADCYPDLFAGIRALEQRQSEIFTPYDGKVEVDRGQTDPRRNYRLVMSASQLEELAKCPYGYYLRYVLNVRPPEEIVYDPGMWLDPMTRGILLHRIFELFYREIRKRGEKPELARHEGLIYQIAHAQLEKTKEEIPPPSDVVYDYEYREIMESCRIFLAREESECRTEPRYFELTFGFDRFEDSVLGRIKPVGIALPSGKVYVKGRIDRVDLDDNGSFIVLDYKSGGTYGYEEDRPYRCGRQLQHTLYALALEEILAEKGLHENPRVTESGYLFPTLKGEGQCVLYKQTSRETFYEILECLCEILGTGAFVMTDEDECRFCEYVEVCGRDLLAEALRAKLANAEVNNILEYFRRLKNYE